MEKVKDYIRILVIILLMTITLVGIFKDDYNVDEENKIVMKESTFHIR